jgi:hypothetical protein
MQRKLVGVTGATEQLLIVYSESAKYLKKKKKENNEATHQVFMDFKKHHVSDRRVVLYNILIECGIPMKLIRLIKIC